jgi:F0F1-type ATP synthase delta subunit
MNEENIADKVFDLLRRFVPAESLEKVIKIVLERVSKEKNKVRVTLASTPSEDLTQEIEKEVTKIFGPHVVTEFCINSEIIGGFILEGCGKYYDYSVGSRINKLFGNG